MSQPHDTLPAEVSQALARLGAAFKTARLRRNLSQQAVADRVGCSRPTVSAAEQGDPGVALGTYMQMAWLYGLHTQWTDALQPDRDTVGLALERRAGRTRARSKQAPLDNDF